MSGITTITLSDVITSLTILREQLKTKAVGMDDGFDELVFTKEEIRLKRGTRTLKIPLAQVNHG